MQERVKVLVGERKHNRSVIDGLTQQVQDLNERLY